MPGPASCTTQLFDRGIHMESSYFKTKERKIIMQFKKGILLLSALLFTASLWLVPAQAAAADKFPDKPITFVIGWSAGGGSDLAARFLCTNAEKYLGQPFCDSEHVRWLRGQGVCVYRPNPSLTDTPSATPPAPFPPIGLWGTSPWDRRILSRSSPSTKIRVVSGSRQTLPGRPWRSL